jgi:hypothetical protein
MTKIAGAVACIIVATDCGQKAMGAEPQSIFSQNATWLWWIVVFMWAINAIQLICEEVMQ